MLEVARMTLERGRIDLAARVLIRGARRASKGQDLVLRTDLLNFAREIGEPLNTAD